MWKVKFTIEDRSLGTGKVRSTRTFTEAGFHNKGQAEAWLATGAKMRYSYAFWHKCAKIEVVDEDPYVMDQVVPPPFYAGGDYEHTD